MGRTVWPGAKEGTGRKRVRKQEGLGSGKEPEAGGSLAVTAAAVTMGRNRSAPYADSSPRAQP